MTNIREDRKEVLEHLQAIQRVLGNHSYVDTFEGAILTLKDGAAIQELLLGSGALSHKHYDGYWSVNVYGMTIRWPADRAEG
jgi:hypothetical protein